MEREGNRGLVLCTALIERSFHIAQRLGLVTPGQSHDTKIVICLCDSFAIIGVATELERHLEMLACQVVVTGASCREPESVAGDGDSIPVAELLAQLEVLLEARTGRGNVPLEERHRGGAVRRLGEAARIGRGSTLRQRRLERRLSDGEIPPNVPVSAE